MEYPLINPKSIGPFYNQNFLFIHITYIYSVNYKQNNVYNNH